MSRTDPIDVLLVEDDEHVRLATTQSLKLAGLSTQGVDSAEAARAWLQQPGFAGVVVCDVQLPGDSGLVLLHGLREQDPELPVILVTGHGDIGMAVEAMRDGAWDFIEKPFSAEHLVEVVRRALAQRRLVLENRRLKAQLAGGPADGLLGTSAAMEQLRTLIATLGPARVDVLIHGETGAGKEVVARALHAASGEAGARGPFVAINCGALPESVFESEIFGAEAGAYTGATRRRIGKLEFAGDGTVFLDEIESMPMALQVKMLRVLQERSVERLGANTAVALGCRIVAATKVDLRALAKEGRFREDLFYRLDVASLVLPPLRQRREDIPLLLGHFAAQAAERLQRPVPAWTAAQLAAWAARDWPGNVRELRNFAERWVLGLVTETAPPSLPTSSEPAALPQAPLDEALAAVERQWVVQALRESGGNIAKAGERLGLARKTLHDRIRRLGLDADAYRTG